MPRLLYLTPGSIIQFGDKLYKISHILDLENVLCRELTDHGEGGQPERFSIKDITCPRKQYQDIQNRDYEISVIPEASWQKACQRREILYPLSTVTRRSNKMVQEAADTLGVSKSTIYRWLEALECNDFRTTALLPHRPSGGGGKSRLDAHTEEILQSTIDEFCKREEKISTKAIFDEVDRRCKNAHLEPPHYCTVRARGRKKLKKKNLKRRLGRQADNQTSPLVGHFPGADWPLAVIQIDHTLLDITLVDDLHRLSIGRPWVTLAMDIYSRVVIGLYISLDPPGNMSAGQCLAHSMLPKEDWLAQRNITTPWSCWGFPAKIHADNAGEFRGDMLKRACQEYGIHLEWRPVKQPEYGAHIERLLGTLLREIHTLPGTTFSNPQERGEYDSEGKAVLTLSEFDIWLTSLVVEDYNQRIHSTLGMPPIKQYEVGVFGTKDQPGCGLQPRMVDEDRLRLDFMPFIKRTIRRSNVEIGKIHYHDSVLTHYNDAKDTENPKRKSQFIFKRNPRDISRIFFYDPNLGRYFPIPYRNKSRPPMTIWEYRKVRRWMLEQGIKTVNEDVIFDARQRRLALVEQAKRNTKSARREAQQRKLHGYQENPQTPTPQITKPSGNYSPTIPMLNVVPFDDLNQLEE
jgi:putative transposase